MFRGWARTKRGRELAYLPLYKTIASPAKFTAKLSDHLEVSPFAARALSRIIGFMDPEMRKKLTPGVKVKITQQIAARDHSLSTVVRGTVTSFGQKQTGSWYAHSKNDKLWLDRLTLRKDDGEISTLNLDEYSVVEFETPVK